MPPNLALALWFVGMIALFRFDKTKHPRTSAALWLPVVALFIIGSRSPTQWLSGGVSISAQSFEEGSPVDRVISLCLILVAMAIVMSRSFKWNKFLSLNIAFVAMVAFGLVSVAWSDFPFVAFKRWFRDAGGYLILLVALSDTDPLEAVRAVLRRVSYLLVSLSILVNKYFEGISRTYDSWTGVGYFQGVATSKNMLGQICLVSGLFFFWDSAARWKDRKQGKTRQILLVNVTFLLMTLYLLKTAQSTTSTVCLFLGGSVIAASYSKIMSRRQGLLKVFVPASFVLYLALNFGLNMSGTLAQSVGKDPTLTDRTKIWAFLLTMHTNPLIGTGYQSFWLGSRLQYFWDYSGLGHINEAHNGYLGLYLDQGLLGVGFLTVFLFSSYRLMCKNLTQSRHIAVLGMAGWTSIVFYNMSEASFGSGMLFWTFLLGAISIPIPKMKRHIASGQENQKISGFSPASAVESLTTPIL
jgi:exopolysaccharide production protein ExoQ